MRGNRRNVRNMRGFSGSNVRRSGMSRRRFMGVAAAGVGAAALAASGIASAQVYPQPSGEIWVYPTGTPADLEYVAIALDEAPAGSTVVLKAHAKPESEGDPPMYKAFNFGGLNLGYVIMKDVSITGEFIAPFTPTGPYNLIGEKKSFAYDGGTIMADRTVITGGLGAFHTLGTSNAPDVSLQRMWFENNYVYAFGLTSGRNILIRHNVVMKPSPAGFDLSMGIYINTHHPIFEPNVGPLEGDVEITENYIEIGDAPQGRGLNLGDIFSQGEQIDGSWIISGNMIIGGEGYGVGIDMRYFNPGMPDAPNHLEIHDNHVEWHSGDDNCWGIFCYACRGAEYAAHSISNNTIVVSNTFTEGGETGCNGIMLEGRCYANPDDHRDVQLIPTNHFSVSKNDITMDCQSYVIWGAFESYGISHCNVNQNHISGTVPYGIFIQGKSVTTRNRKTYFQNAENNNLSFNALQELQTAYYPGHTGYPPAHYVLYTGANFNSVTNTPGNSGESFTYYDFGRGNSWQGFFEKLTGTEVADSMHTVLEEKKRILELLHQDW